MDLSSNSMSSSNQSMDWKTWKLSLYFFYFIKVFQFWYFKLINVFFFFDFQSNWSHSQTNLLVNEYFDKFTISWQLFFKNSNNNNNDGRVIKFSNNCIVFSLVETNTHLFSCFFSVVFITFKWWKLSNEYSRQIKSTKIIQRSRNSYSRRRNQNYWRCYSIYRSISIETTRFDLCFQMKSIDFLFV